MTESEFRRLIRFYIACIESEDRRSLSVRVSALHASLVSPWDIYEPLFHPEASEATFEVNSRWGHDMLSRAAPLAGPEPFIYGYPVFLDENGLLSPLFLIEVDVTHLERGCFVIRCTNPVRPHLNRHVFRRRHAQPEELQEIIDELEGEYGSFAARLRAAFASVDVAPRCFPSTPLEPYPTVNEPGNRWINRPILFKTDRSVHVHHLRDELVTLAKYPRLAAALGATAAGTLAAIVPPVSRSRRGTAPGKSVELLQVLPLNRDQEDAAHRGLGAPITVVTGPPGTGKSQMIVDLLASCALAGRPVLFSSRNNKAVNVVRDRLRAILGPGHDWTLRLGNRAVMNASQLEMGERLLAARSMMAPNCARQQTLEAVSQEIAIVQRRIEALNRAWLEYAQLEQDRRAALSFVDPTWVDSLRHRDCPRLDFAAIDRLAAIAEALAGRRSGLWLRLKCAIAPAAICRSIRAQLASVTRDLPWQVRADFQTATEHHADKPYESIVNACRQLVRVSRWRHAEDACRKAWLTVTTEEPPAVLQDKLHKLQQRRSEIASDELRSVWTNRLAARAASITDTVNRYFDLASRVRRGAGRGGGRGGRTGAGGGGGGGLSQALEFKAAVRSMSASLPIWIVTNLSVRNALPLEPALFDLVILDEASQCDIPSALPLLFRARRLLVVGDPRQLRHISTLPPAEEAHLASEHGVAARLATWSYNECSLYALAEAAVVEQGGEPLFLAEHYRSHPDIIDFSNRRFYQGRLVIRTPVSDLQARLQNEPVGLFWHHIRGEVLQSSRSARNEQEARAVLDLLDTWSDTGLLRRDTVDFGVVTPFRLQMEHLEQAIRSRSWWTHVKNRLTVGTAHQFQGDERDVMIFSPVISTGIHSRLVRWVADTDQLLNVALTRARAALHVVGDLDACAASGGFLGDFAVQAANRNVTPSAARSGVTAPNPSQELMESRPNSR